MKIKLRRILIAIVLIILTYAYAIVDKNNAVYDKKTDTSEYFTIYLAEGNSVQQNFLSNEEKLDGINIKMSASGETDDILVEYQLVDDSGLVVAQGESTLEDMKAGKFFALKFESLSGCKGKNYTFEMKVKSTGTDGQVIIYEVPDENNTTRMVVNNEKAEGVLAIRTITHRFDIETFVVTFCFLLYVILFMRWLVKLFK